MAWCQKPIWSCVWQSWIFWKNLFCSQNWENNQKWTKNGFLNLLKNLVVNFYWICSIMKIYIICCVSTQIPYLGEFLLLRYGPKCSQPIRLQDLLIERRRRTNRTRTNYDWTRRKRVSRRTSSRGRKQRKCTNEGKNSYWNWLILTFLSLLLLKEKKTLKIQTFLVIFCLEISRQKVTKSKNLIGKKWLIFS